WAAESGRTHRRADRRRARVEGRRGRASVLVAVAVRIPRDAWLAGLTDSAGSQRIGASAGRCVARADEVAVVAPGAAHGAIVLPCSIGVAHLWLRSAAS